jgi:Domain of unknown function (DUF4129)
MTARIDDQGPVTLFTRHVVVPAAIIAMVAAFLFYLLEVRSVFLGGLGERETAFKQVGLCFAAATVLIARYGRVHGSTSNENRSFYTVVLAIATLLFMVQASGAASFVPNVLIIAAVWRFATGVTGALSLEGELDALPLPRGPRLYGLERLRFEAFKKKQEEKGISWGRNRNLSEKKPATHGNPVASVARLAALALLGFAVGEPFLLRAAPEVAERALADVIIFLFATALVLAAGSAAGTLRHTLTAGGRVSAGVLPARLALAAFLSVLVLATALAIPGVHFRGQGELRRTTSPGATHPGEGQSDGRQSSDGRSDTRDAPPGGNQGETGNAPQTQPQPKGSGQPPPPVPGVVPLVNVLGVLGKLLLIPLVLGILLLALFAIRYFRPSFPTWRDLLARLQAWLRGKLPPPKPRSSTPREDPFEDLWTLNSLAPRDAVLAAYRRLLLALDQAGHPRAERTAPYEHLNALPKRLTPIAEPARTLTDLYVVIAYGDGVAADGERTLVIAELGKIMRALRKTPASNPEEDEGLEPELEKAG